jgi:hypothetical protein
MWSAPRSGGILRFIALLWHAGDAISPSWLAILKYSAGSMHAAAGIPGQGRPNLLLNFTPRAGAAGGHRVGLLLVMTLAREYCDVPIGGPDVPRLS